MRPPNHRVQRTYRRPAVPLKYVNERYRQIARHN
jgi:hypothetical protein